MNKWLCLIPAKGQSTRLPRKNLLPLGGHPLIAHAIRKAIKADIFEDVCVSTDDADIAETARNYGAEVPFIRPEHLSRDPATIIDVMLHALEYYQAKEEEFDVLCVLLATAPFITVADILGAKRAFENSNEAALLSVTQTEFPPYNAWNIEASNGIQQLTPCFPDSPYKHTKSTECPKSYRSNGAILIVDAPKFSESRGYRGAPIVPYIMPPERSLDIDTEHDYAFATYLFEVNKAKFEQDLFPPK